MKKKFHISILIILTILFNTIPMTLVHGTEQYAIDENKLEFLNAMGIIQDTPQSQYVARGEFAQILAYSLNLKEFTSPAETGFLDVKKDDDYSGSIKMMSDLGILKGYDDSSFRPERLVSYNEAIKSALVLLGYGDMIRLSGDKSEDYLKYAYNIELIARGKSIDLKKNIPYSDMIVLIYNMMHAELLETIYYGDGIQKKNSNDGTLLNHYFDIKIVKDIVYANELTSLNSVNDTAQKGSVKINDVEVKAGNTGIANELGKKVICYIYTDPSTAEKTVVYYELHNDNKILELSSKDVSDVSRKSNGYKISYSTENSKKIKTTNVSYGSSVIYNQRALDKSEITLSDFAIDYGKIVLIDNNADGTVEVAVIHNYDTVVVESVSESDKMIAIQYPENSLKFESNVIKLKDYEEYYIYKNGISCSIGSLKKNDILSLAESKYRDVLSIYASDTTIKGEITGIENDGEYLYVDNEKYEALSECFGNPITVGQSYILYLDINMNIALATYDGKKGMSYGYVLAKDAASLKGAKIKLFSKDNGIEILQLEDRIRFINGESAAVRKESKDVVELLQNETVIKFSTNADGKINKIITSADKRSEQNVEKSAYDDNKLILNRSGSLTCKAYKLKMLGSVYSEYFVDNDTMVYIVPEDVSYEEDFRVVQQGYFAHDGTYNVEIYDSNEYNIARFVVVKVGRGFDEPSVTAPCYMVDEIYKTLNGDGAIVQGFRLNGGGGSGEVNSAREGTITGTVFQADTSSSYDKEVEVGDIIQFSVNHYGEIGKVRIISDKNDDSQFYKANQNKIVISNDLVIVKGTLLFANDYLIKLSVTMDGQEQIYNFSHNDKTAKYFLKVGDLDTIRVNPSDAMRGDTVVLRLRRQELNDVFLIRK